MMKLYSGLSLFGALTFFTVMSALSSELPGVFVIGDSISMHYGPFLEEGLRGDFLYDRKRDTEEEKGWADLDIAKGANGGNSRQVLAYLRDRLEKAPIQADVLVFNCGLHDIRTDVATGRKQIPIAEYESNLREIIRVSEAMGLEPLWLNTCPVIDDVHNAKMSWHRYDKDVLAYNEVAEKVMEEHGVTVVDFYKFCARQLPEGLADHVHFKPEARSKQGEYLAGAIKQWWTACSRSSGLHHQRLWSQTPRGFETRGRERINASFRVERVVDPELIFFPAAEPNTGTALIVFPGGGYIYLDFVDHVRKLADRLNPEGVSVIGLKYRTKWPIDGADEGVPEIALEDARRAVKLVRQSATQWGIDPRRIGVVGQSAGANLALQLACHFDRGNLETGDPVEQQSSRPDFVAVFSSWNFSKNESPFAFPSDAPPIFFRHARDDYSIGLAEVLVKQFEEAGLRTDIRFLDSGGHGAFGLEPHHSGHAWPDELLRTLAGWGFYRPVTE